MRSGPFSTRTLDCECGIMFSSEGRPRPITWTNDEVPLFGREHPLSADPCDDDIVLMDIGMVVPAQEDALISGSLPVMLPPPQGVMNLAELRRFSARRILAMSVSGDDGSGLVRGEDPLLPPDVDDRRFGSEHDPGEFRATCQSG